MATLNAASRLREQVLNVPHTVLLVSPGHPDKVVRFNRAPEALTAYRIQCVKQINPNYTEADFKTVHTPFNLGNGPQSEAWASICDEVKRQARRDIPTPMPEEVSPDSKTDWMLGPEDVPVVELQGSSIFLGVNPADEKKTKEIIKRSLLDRKADLEKKNRELEEEIIASEKSMESDAEMVEPTRASAGRNSGQIVDEHSENNPELVGALKIDRRSKEYRDSKKKVEA